MLCIWDQIYQYYLRTHSSSAKFLKSLLSAISSHKNAIWHLCYLEYRHLWTVQLKLGSSALCQAKLAWSSYFYWEFLFTNFQGGLNSKRQITIRMLQNQLLASGKRKKINNDTSNLCLLLIFKHEFSVKNFKY